jgi:hypothetical protein
MRWAVSNDLIILYPNAVYDYYTNPLACHNAGGSELDPNYAYNTGWQPKAIMKMVDRLGEPRVEGADYSYDNANELWWVWSEPEWVSWDNYFFVSFFSQTINYMTWGESINFLAVMGVRIIGGLFAPEE